MFVLRKALCCGREENLMGRIGLTVLIIAVATAFHHSVFAKARWRRTSARALSTKAPNPIYMLTGDEGAGATCSASGVTDAAYLPGFPATGSRDFSTGISAVNAYNLVFGSAWTQALSAMPPAGR